MNQDARVYSMMVEHDRAVPMIEQIDQIMDALLDHDLIVPITKHEGLQKGARPHRLHP
jgi:hypothetical protein